MSRHKGNVTVLCFYADKPMTKYHFNSKPDLERIQAEMKTDGGIVCLVFNQKNSATRSYFVYVTRFCIDYMDISEIGQAINIMESIFGKAKDYISVQTSTKSVA